MGIKNLFIFLPFLFQGFILNAQIMCGNSSFGFAKMAVANCKVDTISLLKNLPDSSYSTIDNIHNYFIFSVIQKLGNQLKTAVNFIQIDSGKISKTITIPDSFTDIQYCDSDNNIYGISHQNLLSVNSLTVFTQIVCKLPKYHLSNRETTFDQKNKRYLYNGLSNPNLEDFKTVAINTNTGSFTIFDKYVSAPKYASIENKLYGTWGLWVISYDLNTDIVDTICRVEGTL